MSHVSLVFKVFKLHWVAAVCLVAAAAPPQNMDEWSALTTRAGEAYKGGAYTESEKLYSSALTLARKLGPEDDRLAATLSNLGTCYRAQGRYTEAEKLYRQALELREAMFGPQQPGHPVPCQREVCGGRAALSPLACDLGDITKRKPGAHRHRSQ
jgi:tetratricopeptide (TPR) repeat protein